MARPPPNSSQQECGAARDKSWCRHPSPTVSTLFGEDDAGELSLAIHVGDVIAAKYRVHELLAVGGMGVVVSAQHMELEAGVAIKLLLPHLCGETEAITQFAREVWAVAKIGSEHVARVFDVGSLESGAPYMVMELLDGQDLEAWLHQHGPLPVEQAVDFVLQACEAIAEAHALGIVHRDLKPSNLFVTRRSNGALSVKVLDFGISMMTGRKGSGWNTPMKRPRSVTGSPLYMSPEQMETPDEVDGRTDIWSLGVCLYELISGFRPFAGNVLPAIRSAVTSHVPTPIRSFRPDVPAGIERVVSKCLRKSRRARYGSVAELAVALKTYAPRRSWSSVERIKRVIAYGAETPDSLAAVNLPAPLEGACSMAESLLSRSRTSILQAAEGLMARAALAQDAAEGGPASTS